MNIVIKWCTFSRSYLTLRTFWSLFRKKKSRASGFFFLYFSLFTFHSSLFSTPFATFPDKREKRREKRKAIYYKIVVRQFNSKQKKAKISFLSPLHKKKSRASGFSFLYFSLFSFHSSLFSKSPARLFQRRDKREERKEGALQFNSKQKRLKKALAPI